MNHLAVSRASLTLYGMQNEKLYAQNDVTAPKLLLLQMLELFSNFDHYQLFTTLTYHA